MPIVKALIIALSTLITLSAGVMSNETRRVYRRHY